MYYSVTFIVNGVTRNTWDDWGMIPNTPPMIPAPEPETNYVEIPGRTLGPLDMTGVAFGHVTYKRMTGTWTFLKDPVNGQTRKQLYETLIAFFNGKAGKVILKDEDPAHYYQGRFRVNVPTTSRGPMAFQIAYDLVPARWNVSNDTRDSTYGT